MISCPEIVGGLRQRPSGRGLPSLFHDLGERPFLGGPAVKCLRRVALGEGCFGRVFKLVTCHELRNGVQ